MKTPLQILGSFLLPVVIVFLYAPAAVGGESDREVREKCLGYLGKKYGKEFRIVSYKRYFHGGLWKHRLNITASPGENPKIQFKVRYNYSEGRVTGDQYKKAFWEEQVSADVKNVLKGYSPVKGVRATLRANNSLVFNTSELEFYGGYRELVEHTRHPRLKLEFTLENTGKNSRAMRGLVKLAEYFSKEKFEKVEFSVAFDKGGAGPRRLLKFKIKRGMRAPWAGELAGMIYTKGKDEYLRANRKLYAEAEKKEKGGDIRAALLLYGKIMGRERPYRFREYIISESASVVEAAFRMAKIYDGRGDRKNALRFYRFLLKKMEYTEVPLRLGRSVKEARRRVEVLENIK